MNCAHGALREISRRAPGKPLLARIDAPTPASGPRRPQRASNQPKNMLHPFAGFLEKCIESQSSENLLKSMQTRIDASPAPPHRRLLCHSIDGAMGTAAAAPVPQASTAQMLSARRPLAPRKHPPLSRRRAAPTHTQAHIPSRRKVLDSPLSLSLSLSPLSQKP